MKKFKNQGGQSLIEVICVLAVGAVLLTNIIGAYGATSDAARISTAIESIQTIETAAEQYYHDNGGTFTGVTFALLKAKGLPNNFVATGSNPWLGDYTIGPNSGDPTLFDVKLTAVPTAAIATKLTNAMAKNAYSAPTYDATTKIWSVTVK
jgi:prepilin-type N-terminal cleavage/methylation domain-containing protein